MRTTHSKEIFALYNEAKKILSDIAAKLDKIYEEAEQKGFIKADEIKKAA